MIYEMQNIVKVKLITGLAQKSGIKIPAEKF